jgi:FkbM family methyltransferase
VIGSAQRFVAAAARSYVMRFPVARGKGFVIRTIAPRLALEHREFDAVVPGGGIVALRWDEVVGRHVLRHGSFEEAEVETARACLATRDVAIDVGANVGLIAIPLALAVGPLGRVVAVEPLPENVERLERNIRRNNLDNVTVVAAAAGPDDGELELNVAADPAFASAGAVTKYRATGTLTVPCRRLDSLWRELGHPQVALVKIDVEGAELGVLDGAVELLHASRPVVLVEADIGEAADAVASHLESAGYVEATPAGFSAVNHLFRPSPT